MARNLIVVRASRTLIGTHLTVEANGYATATYDSFLGEREFYLQDGHRITVLVKGRGWNRGDRLSMSELVGVVWNWSSLPWCWA